MHIEDALERFLVQLEADGRSPHTIGQYRRHVGLLAAWLAQEGHSGAIADLDHEALARFLVSPEARQRRGGRAKLGTTTNALRSSIRCFARYSHDAGFLDRDPGRLIRRARTASAPPRGLTPDEQKRLVDTLAREDPDGRDQLLFRLLLEAGLRIGEALALTTDDVDLDAGELVLRATKGDRPARAPIPRRLRGLLRRYLNAVDEGPLLPGRGGWPITARHANRRLRFWLEQAGIRRRISPHGLRHAFGMEVYRRSGDLLIVQAALRHRSLSSTTVYARADREELRCVLRA